MKTFADKVREGRQALGLTQAELGQLCGVSQRSIAAYETGGARPHRSMQTRLAKALRVSERYLADDAADESASDPQVQAYVNAVRDNYGDRAAREMDQLLERNAALFAGGSIPQEAKDAFFEAVMKAYLTCKEEARKTYGNKNKPKE